MGEKIGILGAGAIGCHMGGALIAGQQDVILVGRDSLRKEVLEYGIRLTDLKGKDVSIEAKDIKYATAVETLANMDFVLVTVKSQNTAEACSALQAVLKKDAVLISFQNGIGNSARLQELFPKHTVLSGMVGYNVVRKDNAHFHLATSGPLAIQDGVAAKKLAWILRSCAFEVELYKDLEGVKWTKLLLNLNNAINALADVPLRTMLQDRNYRLISAQVIREALACMKAVGIKPRRYGKIFPSLPAKVLRLPNFLFFRVAKTMIEIDPQARTSMWDDLARGRKTEIDYLNGEIVKLAESTGIAVPANRAITKLIKKAESTGSPGLSPGQINEAIAKEK